MEPRGTRACVIYMHLLKFLKDEHWDDAHLIPSCRLFNMFVEREGCTDLDGGAADTAFRIIEDVRCDRDTWEMNLVEARLCLGMY